MSVAGALTVTVAGEEVTLLPDRALLWRDTAFVADVHWGKSATFRSVGIPVPDGELDEDLARLGVIAGRVKRIVVLGDLVHAAVEPSVAARVAAWRAAVPIPMALVRGNHDRHAPQLPKAWGIEDLGPGYADGPFHFRHEPGPGPGFVWSGHVHPGVVLRAGSEWLRLPCFHVGPSVGILPAFGRFTGSVNVPLGPEDTAYGIVDDEVIRIGPRAARSRK